MRLDVMRSIYLGHVGDCKTEASRKPVPLDDRIAAELWLWKETSRYRQADDWIFASPRTRGKYPFWPDAVLTESHSTRGIASRDRKENWVAHFSTHILDAAHRERREREVVQELMRHASSRCTLEVYSQARILAKRQAQQRVVQMILPTEADAPEPLLACESQNRYSVSAIPQAIAIP